MDICEREKNKFHVLDISGKINRLNDSVDLRTHITELIEKHIYYIALNLARVSYLDSGALNVLIFSYNSLLKNNGKLVIIEPNDYVRDVIEVVGLDKIVKIYSKEEDFENDKENF